MNKNPRVKRLIIPLIIPLLLLFMLFGVNTAVAQEAPPPHDGYLLFFDSFNRTPDGVWYEANNPAHVDQMEANGWTHIVRTDTSRPTAIDTRNGVSELVMYGYDGDRNAHWHFHVSDPLTVTVIVSTTSQYVSSGYLARIYRIEDDQSSTLICDGRPEPGLFLIDCPITAGDYFLYLKNTAYCASTSICLDRRWRIDSIALYSSVDLSPAPAPPPPPPLHQTSCYLAIDPAGAVLTATDTITGATGLTNTVTITAPANLVQNSGFEAGYVIPDNWTFDQPLYAPGMWVDSTPEEARGKIIRSYTTPALELTQAISLPTSPAYLIGLDVDYPAGVNNATLRLGLDQLTISPGGDDWRTISTTVQTSGERNIQLQLPATTALDEIRADDLFVVPVETDEFGAVIGIHCASVGEHYQQSNPTPPPAPVSPVPPAPSGAGTYPAWTGTGASYCTTCPVPSSILQVGAWVAWLGCVLANLFFCHLATWLGNIFGAISNLLLAIPAGFNALIAVWNNGAIFAIESIWGWFSYSLGWAASSILGAGAWGAGIISSIWNVYIPDALASLWNAGIWVANNTQYIGIWAYNGVINFSSWLVNQFWAVVQFLDPWELFLWFVRLPIVQHILNIAYYWGTSTTAGQIVLYALATVFMNLYESLLEMWELLRIIFNAFRGVFVGDEYSVFINVNGDDLEIIEPAALHEQGMNATKMLWLGLAALATVDYALEVFPLALPLWLAVGGVAFYVISWTLKQWQEILPFG